MKNLKTFLLLVLISLTYTACDNEPLEGFEEEGNNPFGNSLVGTWALVDFDVSVVSTTEVGGISVESSSLVDGLPNPDYNLTFTNDAFFTTGSYGYTATTTVNGITNSQDLFLENVTGAGTYTATNTELTIDGSFFTIEFQGMDFSELQGEQTINYSISADGQTLTFIQDTTEVNSAGGATSTSTVTGSSTWTKIDNIDTSCDDATAFAEQAEIAYNNNQDSVNLCISYKSALEELIDSCGDSTGEIQSIIDGLGNCEEDDTQPVPVVEISLTAGTLPIEFDLVEVVTVGNILQVTGETSAANNYSIYFEVEEGATGMEIINDTFVLTLSTTDPDYFPSTQGFDDFTSTITENGTGTLVGSFGGVVSNSSGGDLSLSQGTINISY
ncbi:hypothetical protein [Lacinutrix sp. 5H-3-7-4]|uniref:hypothetical protein n=1 Tax=Lacinutrix sp. (strain 5H-3-7-4) TaxID=983544 RepID=UPI00020A3E81|nr:hypothetical protein [Lacinutrix sp. 5H-3-7-4]AEH02517.1 hypothetical protein Lacal_2677 [Lacinutrix sp. 5H-3-7-4]